MLQNSYSEGEDESASEDDMSQEDEIAENEDSSSLAEEPSDEEESSSVAQIRDYPPESELTALTDNTEEMSVRVLFEGKVVSSMSREQLVRNYVSSNSKVP